MRRKLAFSIFLLMVTFSSSFAQLDISARENLWEICPLPLPNISQSDTIAWQASVDSVSMMMAGKWNLLEVSNGWTYPRKPDKVVELTIDQAGNGQLYENGIFVSTVRMRIKRVWRRILFDFEQEGESTIFPPGLFKHSGHRGPERNEGAINVCPNKLAISDNYADGMNFVFRRVP